ncbi:hypothetical protein [Silanimonas sp.]|jgi:hypothetical protein|uniref:hypothetical protein n=1 Tax=Silanimonas sp. TaxID=1929290 RepID=UPI0037C5486B
MAVPTSMQRASDRSATPAPGPGEATVLPMAACLIVGVTAHRDLVPGEVPALEAAVDALLASAQAIHLPLAEGNDAASVCVPGPARDRQYAQLGVFISSHCQVLLALWHGTASDAAGGTSDVVRYHLHGEMPGLGRVDAPPNLLADDDSDLAFHIVCSRTRSGATADGALGTHWLTRGARSAGSGPMPDGYVQLFDQLGEFNADSRLYA